ncbi:hypothetical protein STA3757_49590 (plasmid) [Stanieria sp. NIES-3757]|nr:hypothetical protein STA3757_49590 [Stanieria sp. NIES-3757]
MTPTNRYQKRSPHPQTPTSNNLVFFYKWLCYLFQDLLIVPSSEVYGDAIVTKKLAQQSRWVAGILTVTNLINAASSFPLLLLTLIDFGIFGWLLAIAIELGLIKFSNWTGVVAIAYEAQHKNWNGIGLAGVVLINIVQSFVGGVGTLILLDRPSLSDRLSEQLIQERVIFPQEKKIEALQIEPQQLTEAKNQCQNLEARLAQTPPNSPKRGSLFPQAYGSWQDYNLPLPQRSYYTSPVPQWPWCPKSSMLTEIHAENLATAEKELEQLKVEIAKKGNLSYLHSIPDVYTQNFDENDEIKSSMKATAIALDLFFSRLKNGEWAMLGLSLYVFILSVVTSGIAVGLIATHAQREDVQMSWSEAAAEAFIEFLKQKRQEQFELHRVSSQKDLILTSSDRHNYSLNGKSKSQQQ